MNDERGGALRPLKAAAEHIGALRSDSLDSVRMRRALLGTAHAVEACLRRLLRGSPGIPIELRLRALASDELRDDEVLAELRQHDRISLELAAAVHELLEARHRLRLGAEPTPSDVGIALRAVERIEQEVTSDPLPAPPPPPPPDEPARAEETVVLSGPPSPGPFTRRRIGPIDPRWLGALAALALLVLLGYGVALLAGPDEDPNLARGIALFRSGAYAEAASHFWRYAEEHPDDATPRLYLARIHRRMGRPDLAAPEVRRALELAPSDAGAHAELGFLLLDSGEHEVAVRRFRTAIRLDAESSEAWIGLVRALQASGRAAEAQRVLGLAPEPVRDLFARTAPAGEGSPP